MRNLWGHRYHRTYHLRMSQVRANNELGLEMGSRNLVSTIERRKRVEYRGEYDED